MNTPQETRKKEWSKHWLPIAFVLILSAPVVLVWLFYWEEDTRGAAELAAMRAKWEAKGVSFDLDTYIPPPIPDAKNLTGIPLFKQTYDSNEGFYVAKQLLSSSRVLNQFYSFKPPQGISFKSKVDSAKHCTDFVYTQLKSRGMISKAVSMDELDRINALYEPWNDILRESHARPGCRLDLDYTGIKTSRRFSITLVHYVFYLDKYATIHAILELDKGKPNLAFEDLGVIGKFLNGISKTSDGERLFSSTVISDFNTVLESGLENHSWTDQQLSDVQSSISQLDYMQNIHVSYLSFVCIENIYLIKDIKVFRKNIVESYDGFIGEEYFKYWPTGWIDINEAKIFDYLIRIGNSVNIKDHLIDIKSVNDIKRELMSYGSTLAPNGTMIDVPCLGEVRLFEYLGKAQTELDQAYIACALERYYLQKHSYPSKLEELVPQFATSIPHDIIGGKPYIYKLNKHGTFLLYSVGWNEVDDGGITSPNYGIETGDWVWPGHGGP